MLTQRQIALFGVIDASLKRCGSSPSFEEMCQAIGANSKATVHRLLTCLESRGFIRRIPHRSRAIEILRYPQNMAGESNIFTITRSAAGLPLSIDRNGTPFLTFAAVGAVTDQEMTAVVEALNLAACAPESALLHNSA
jgi:repressor LexA